MSKNSPPDPSSPDFQTIAVAAGAAGAEAQQETADDRIAAIEDRIATVEPLLEQLQANAQLGPKLTEYVDDLRDEQKFFNRARYAVGCLSLLVTGGLIALLWAAIFHAKSPLLAAPPLAIATFVIGLVSSIAIIMNSFVKGVFRSTADRHADGFLPPALEKAVELMNKVVGKG